MAQTVKLRRSALPGRVPNNAQLELGELSMNTTDGKIFLAKSGSNGPSVEEVIITNTQNTGSIELVGSISSSFFTGSFIGDGSRLTNIQASGVTGLSLDRIANTTATASISPSGFSVNVNTSITGSLTATSITGSGLGLTDVPFHITGSDGTSTSDKQFTKLLFDDSTGIKLTETVDGVARVYLEGVAAEGSGDGRTSKLEVTESSSIWVLTHGLNERYPAITVFDSNGDVIIPQRIETVSVNQLKVYFNNPQTGVVTATLGGGLPIISASYDGRVLSVNDGVATWKDGIVSSSLQFDSTTDPFTGSFYGTFRGDIQGTANITGDFIPVLTDTYNLGSVDKQWKDLFLSSGSLYIDGTKVISSNTAELIISTDVGQSLKFLETGADDITLQTENGNIELKGTVEILSGKKILDSAGTIIQFGDSLGVTGSIEVSGTVDGIDLQQFSSSVSNLNINNDSRLGLLETASGSIINDFNTYTSSNNTTNTTQNNRIGSLEVESGSIRSEFNDFTSSLDTALEFTGSDVTIKGNLLVKGTESRINSTTIDVNDNIISLNGSGAVFGGLEVRDVTAPGVVSGSLLWDSNGNYWIGGQKGTEVRFLNTDDLTTLNVTLGTLQTESGSIRGDFNSYTQSNNSTNSDQNRRLDGLDIFSGSAKLRLNSIETLTSSLASISSVTDVRDDFNTYTSSNDATNNTQNGKLGLLETASGSIRGDFNDYTSSNNSLNNTQNGRLSSLENASGSVRNELNNYTSSNNTTNTNQNGRLTSLEVETGSINSNILTLDGRIEDVEITLGQLDSIYATDGDVTNLRNDLNAYTSSTDGRQSTQDGRLNALETKTGSLDTDITAIDSRLDSLEGVTGSFITGYTETQTLDDVTDLGSTTTNSIGVGGLDSTGAISINSTNVIDDNRRIYGSGTASNTIPAFTFAGDTNTGLSRIGEDAVGLVAAGSRKFYVSNTHAYFQNLPSGVTINGAGLRVEGNATITGSTTAGSFIKSGGSPSEFLKADGSVDENTYLTAHPSVVAATSSNNSGRTYIQDILLDSFGHISGITTATETVVNTDLYTTGATFNNSNGILTFTKNNSDTYTVNLASTLTDVTVTGGTYDSGSQTLRLTKSDGSTVDVSGFAIDTDVNWYSTGATFNSTNGIITFTRNDGGTFTVDIDGKYAESGHNHDADYVNVNGDTMTGNLKVRGNINIEDGDLIMDSGTVNGTNYRKIRFTEDIDSNAGFQGGFIHYNADDNFFQIGTHNTSDTNVLNDVYHISMTRGTGDVTINNNITASSFIKRNGTSSQFLMADGSVSTNPGWLTAHPSVSAATSSNNSGRTYIQDILLDGFGHITGLTTATETVINTDTNNYANSVSWNSDTGVISIGREGLTTLTVDIDGRFIPLNGDAVISGVKTFETALTNEEDWINSPISILERDGIGSGSTENIYSPNLNFHWRNRVSRSIWMDSTGNFHMGEYSSTGVPTNTGTLYLGDGNSSQWNTAYGWGNHASAGYLTVHPSVSAAGSSNNSGRTYIQDILLDSFGHITGITTSTETVVNTDTIDYVSNVTLNDTTLRFEGVGNGFTGDVDLSIFTTDVTVTGGTYNSGNQILTLNKNNGTSVNISGFAIDTDVNWYTTGATFNTGNGIITFTRNDGGTYSVDVDGKYAESAHTHTFASLTSKPTTLSGYGITDAATSAQGTKADSAYGWGNHASAGYLTSYTETDTFANVVSRGNSTSSNIRVKRPSNKVDNNGNPIEFGGRVEFNNDFVSGESGYMAFRYPTYNNFLIAGDYDGNIGGGIPNIQFGKQSTVYIHMNSSNGYTGYNTTTPQKRLDIYNGSTRGIFASFGSTFSPNEFGGIHFGYSESGLGNDSYKKSALVFERTDNHGQGGNASGRIHFLLNNRASASADSISESVMVIDTDASATQGSARVTIGKTGTTGELVVNGTITATGGNSGNWNTAYGWGDHSTRGYLTSYTDTNNFTTGATFNTGNGIITFTRNNGNTYTVDIDGKYAESVHTHDDRYFTETESDARYPLSRGAIGTSTTVGDATGFGNNKAGGTYTRGYVGHGGQVMMSHDTGGSVGNVGIETTYYGAMYVHTNVDSSSWVTKQIWTSYNFTSTNITNWDTAYGWGNHASAGYLTSYTDTNNHVTGATFNTGNGIITLTKNDGTTVTVDIDGRFLTSYTETDTLASVTARGASTTTDITVQNVLINDGSALGGTNTFDTYKRLTFSNSHSDVARGPNKITMYNNGGAWLGGFGIHSGTVSYYSGDNHTWYKSDSQTSFTEVMRLSNGGNLTLLGTLTASGYNKTNWDTAYGWGNHASAGYTTTDYYTTGATFNSGTGIVTFTRNNGATYTLNIAATLTDVTVTGGTYNSGTQTLRLTKSDGNTVDVSGFAIDTDVNWYTTGATFNNSNGIITGTHQGGTWTVDIDGRYLELGGGTLTGDLTVGAIGKTSDSVIRVLAEQSYKTGFEAYGNGQGTGYLYVGQSAEYGGGISYNGDGAPAFVNGETADYITFYRREAGTNTEVFAFPYSNNNVYFNGEVHAGGGNSSQWNTAYGWGDHAGLYSLVSHTHTFASLTSKPTTISGYGITDAITTSNIGSQNVSSANILNSLGNYIWNASSLPSTFSGGITTSFVSDTQGFPSYGSLMMMKTYDGGGGSLQLYTPYSELYGGSRIGVRFGNYASSNGNSWTGWKYLLNSVSDPYAYNMNQNVRTTDAVTFTTITANGGDSSQWNTAYGWGNHAGLYSLVSHTHTFASLTSKPTTVSGYGITDMGSQSVSYAATAGSANSVSLTTGRINLLSGVGGASFGANHYSIGVDVADGGWSGPNYGDLIIGYHTGIRLGASYTGIRFYNNSPTTDTNNDGNGDVGEALIMTVGGAAGSTNVLVAGTISASNFSGTSSGTNTGDQTNISGNAATATTATNLGADYTADDWFRATGDNNPVKFYGNTYQMTFRTDGASEAYSGIGGYPFVWSYGGSTSETRIMLLADTGRLWTKQFGWLDEAFASSAQGTNADTAYGWGNHASGGYIVKGSTVAETSSWADATKFRSNGDISQTTAGNHSLQVYADINNDAFMAFHISSDYAVYFGLENATNRLYTGGWSTGADKHQIWDSRDFSSTNISNWNTSYGWGNHAGLYLSASGKAADSELLDGVDSGYYVKSGAGASVSGWLIDAFRNGSGTSPRIYMSASTGYGMHINTYNTSASVYGLEITNNAMTTFMVYNDGDVIVGKDLEVTGDLKMQGTDSYIWTPNTAGGFTGFWDQYNSRIAANFSNNVGWGFLGDPESGYAIKSHGSIRTTGSVVASGSVNSGSNFYADANYGYGLVGLYSSTRYQGVFAMGDSYKLSADGTTTGSLYGIAWTHSNVGGQSISGLSHQMLIMENGTTRTALGTGVWTNGNVEISNSTGSWFKNGNAWFGRNHAYDTAEIRGYGSELMIGSQGTELHINYRTCNNGTANHTPTNWYWRAGSSTSYSNHFFGEVRAQSFVTVNGDRIGSGTLTVRSGGAGGVGWGTGLNLGDSSSYYSVIQDTNISRFRNYGGGGYQWFNSSASVAILELTNGGDLLPYNGVGNLGSSTRRWANIYTNDLHLSNEGKVGGNDVDGTTGSWTIQEGSEDLYLINNKNGKKYKISLSEV